MDSRFDDLLHTVIVEKGNGVFGFMDVIMGFLYRRTDFFYEMAPGENMGFFPGQAEGLIYNFFRKYRELHYKERVPKRNIDPKEIEEYVNSQKGKSQTQTKKEAEVKSEKVEIKKIEEQPKVQIQDTKKSDKIDLDNNAKEVLLNKAEQKEEKFNSISTYNGDACDIYNWSQGTNEIQIQFKLPPNTGAKKLTVDIKATKVIITLKETQQLFFEGEFCEKIKVDDSHWLCEDSSSMILYLTKQQDLIWKSAFKGHKEIDTKTVDNSKRIDEFDNETQSALNKIVYEQNRKKQGLPTSEEEKKLAQLKEAWDKPDSPFRGQPFDPKMFNLNEPIYYNTPDYEAKLKWEQANKK